MIKHKKFQQTFHCQFLILSHVDKVDKQETKLEVLMTIHYTCQDRIFCFSAGFRSGRHSVGFQKN